MTNMILVAEDTGMKEGSVRETCARARQAEFNHHRTATANNNNQQS